MYQAAHGLGDGYMLYSKVELSNICIRDMWPVMSLQQIAECKSIYICDFLQRVRICLWKKACETMKFHIKMLQSHSILFCFSWQILATWALLCFQHIIIDIFDIWSNYAYLHDQDIPLNWKEPHLWITITSNPIRQPIHQPSYTLAYITWHAIV